MRRQFIMMLIMLVCATWLVQAQSTVETELLRAINDARFQNGIAPLIFNEQLQQAAQAHTEDMARNARLSHTGSNGSQFWERIQATGYRVTSGAENVLSRPDVNPQAAFMQWYESPPHRQNLLNAAYAEAGIGIATATDGTVYMSLVLATREGVLPVSLPTQTPTALLPTVSPTIVSTPLPTALPTRTIAPTDVRIATIVAPLPTNTAQPDMPVIRALATNTPLPTATPRPLPDLRLVYDDASFTLTNVAGRPLNLTNLVFEGETASLRATRWDTEFLSQPLGGFTADDCLQVWIATRAIEPKPEGCRFRHGWLAVGEDEQFWLNTDRFVVLNGTRRIAVCDVSVAACEVNMNADLAGIPLPEPPSATIQPADLRLTYDAQSLTLVNVSGRPLNLRGLRFNSSSGEMLVERWDTAFLSQPLEAFSAGDCLQVWGLEMTDLIAKPLDCQIRHAWIAVGDSYDFWREADAFTVSLGDVTLTRCLTSRDTCDFVLDVGDSAATVSVSALSAEPQSVQAASIRLVVAEESLTLINMSSSELDVSNLRFVSRERQFSASRWNVAQLSRPLTALPAGDCLQVWPVGMEWQASPQDCAVRHAWVAVSQSENVWQDTRVFEVWNGDTLINTCETRVLVCDVSL